MRAAAAGSGYSSGRAEMRARAAPFGPPCLRYFALRLQPEPTSGHAATIVQDPDPPAPALEAALVHAAVPLAARTPRLLDPESPQRDARVRARAVHFIRAAARAHHRRDRGRAGAAA